MRAYFFCNMYLSSIQQGIQSAHCLAEMYNTYLPVTEHIGECCYYVDEKNIYLTKWAFEYKTIIVLNAGYSSKIRELVKFFGSFENPYPWAFFKEEKDALDEALTCAGIILPEKIYFAAADIRSKNSNDVVEFMSTGKLDILIDGNIVTEEYSKWEINLIKYINSFGLAK